MALSTETADLLDTYRTAWSEGGEPALRDLGSHWHEIADDEPAEDEPGALTLHYELLGWDALALEHPGWAVVCFEASAAHADRADDATQRDRMRRLAGDVLEAHFPPYETGSDCLDEVRTWARARIVELQELGARPEGADERTAPGSVVNRTMARKHRWMFRLLRSRRSGRRYRFDHLFDRFGLSAEDRVLLRTLAAVHWDRPFEARLDGPLTVGTLIDLLADDREDRQRWLDRFDPRSPLVRWRLVHLGGPGALRGRAVEVDPSVPAWLQERSWWPHALEGVATLEPPADRRAWPWQQQAAQALARALDQAVDAPRGPRIALACPRPEPALDLLLAEARRAELPVLVAHASAVDRASAALLAREARLRGAPLWLDGLPDRGTLAELLDRLRTPLVLPDSPAARRQIDDLAALEVPLPPAEERPALWNEALVGQGLAELHPERLADRLGDRPLYPADIRRIASQAAAVARARSGAAAPSVTADDLQAAADAWAG